MNTKKIAALKALGLSQELIEQLLAEVVETEKSAEREGVRYKGANMKNGLDVADALRSALETIEDSVWAKYARGDDEAAIEMSRALIARCKAAIDPEHTSPGMALYERATKAVGEDTVMAALQALLDQATSGRSTLTDSGPQSVSTKSVATDFWATAAQGNLRHDGRPR